MPETETEMPTEGGRYVRDPITGALTLVTEEDPAQVEPIPSGGDTADTASPKSKKGA